MKNKSALCLAAITLAAFAACADPLRGELDLYCPEDHFLFRTIDNDTAVEITGYVGGRIDVRIPPYIRGLPVTVIGERAFVGGEWIPDENWEFVFVAGHQLASVAIPDNVTNIARAAFIENRLASVSISDGVTYIGGDAFAGNQLTYVYIPNGITSIEGGAFADNQLTFVTIPENVTHIWHQAFARNNLTGVIIPNSVIHIDRFAFTLNELTYVVIPNSEVWVCGSAFDYPEVTVTIGID